MKESTNFGSLQNSSTDTAAAAHVAPDLDNHSYKSIL